MRAVDTNVVVRYLVVDDADQSRRARAVFDGCDLFVAMTVVLETEWVLRSVYRFTPAAIIAALRAFAGLPGVSVEDPEQLGTVLHWAAAGIDFADAVHLVQARSYDAFVSFDRSLARLAVDIADISVVEP